MRFDGSKFNTERVLATHAPEVPTSSPESPLFSLIRECAWEGLDPFQLAEDGGGIANASCESRASCVAAHEMRWELFFSMSDRVLTLTRYEPKARRTTAEPEILGAVGIQGVPERWFFVVQGTSAELPPGLDEFRGEFGGINPTSITQERARHYVGVLLRAFEALAHA